MIGFFYGQTEYNYLENAISLDNYVNYCTKYGYDFITITDKNLHGYFKFYNQCLKNNVKPIIGLKITLTSQEKILAYALNNNGLKHLFKISLHQEENSEVSKEVLDKYKQDIIFVVPDDNSIHTLLLNNDVNKALTQLKELNFNNVFLGVNGTEDVKILEKIKQENNIKFLPILNCNYLDKEDYQVYQTLTKISNIKEKDNANHLMNKEEYLDVMNKYQNLFDLTFVDDIKYDLNSKISLPVYRNDISNSDEYLKQLATKGLKRRLELINKTKEYDKYNKRLSYELDVINSMGYNDYFLIVWDLIKYAKNKKILVGPGRGSAAGSLISYCLGITEINPLEYDLFFERFLNPQRVTMPDIDIDFPDDKREEVIKYVSEKYGKNHVCYISAFNTFGIKSSVRDICRVNNINLDHVNLMLKHIDDFGLDSAVDKYSSREELLNVLTIANKIKGLIRHISTHAAGIILSSVELNDFIPLRQGVNGIYQSQLEATDMEKIGFLKIDFLGIKNLTLLDNMSNVISNFNLKDISLSDKKTFELFKKGDTNGIFQLESTGIKNVLRKLKPDNFSDIVSVLALYRPGPMDNIDLYIKRKEGEKITYITKELEPILKETYGIIVYQEQIMQIANKIAGYSYAEADILRRAVSKKSKEVLDENRQMFVSRAKTNNIAETLSNEIYDLIVKFADYGFNKSHSVAYARLSYEMAFIKANYPIVFISEMINNVISDNKELINYINYAKTKQIEVVTPKINYSDTKTLIIKNKILLPFNVIKKLGTNISSKIVEQRIDSKYTSFDDFKERTKDFINETVLENLIFSGCFDEFKISKKSLIEKNKTNDLFAKYVKDSVENESEYNFKELKEKEEVSLGFNLNYNIFNNNTNKISKYRVISDISQIKENTKIHVIANITSIKSIETKNSETMAFLDLDLNFTKINGVIFPKQYDKLNIINIDELVIIDAVIQKRNEELQIVVNNIKNI